MKEYLVEVVRTARHWVKAATEEEAEELAENMEEDDNVDIEDVRVIDEREIEDEDDYLQYLDDDEENDINPKTQQGLLLAFPVIVAF